MNSNAKVVQNRINAMLDQATDLAYSEVERLARRAMRRYTRCASFCMAMGGATFYSKDGHPIEEEHKAYREIDEFLYGGDGVNGALKITGCPMKIKGENGELLKDW